MIIGTLFDSITIDFPIENDLSIVIGVNGSYKSHTLRLLTDYFIEKEENVVFLPDTRFFKHTENEIEHAVKILEDKNLVRKMLNPKKFPTIFERTGMDIAKMDIDSLRNQTMESGYAHLLDIFVSIVNGGGDPIVIIDEPEKHLSLGIQEEMIQMIQDIGVKKLIMATHAPSVIGKFWDNVVKIDECTAWKTKLTKTRQ